MGHFDSRTDQCTRKTLSKEGNTLIDIQIDQIQAFIENKPTQIEEKSYSVLKYKTPHFRALATVKFPPLKNGEIWKLGWIQACTKMKFYNTYGRHGFWEFPDLINKKKTMISDSDGKNFPWYGNKTEVCLIKGPKTSFTAYSVSMNDNFYPHITWDIPTSTQRKSRLTKVKRDQSFLTWLVATDVINGQLIVLKTLKWRMLLEIQIDPNKELGKRAKLVSNPVPDQPELLKHNIDIPECALFPSNANGSQYLIWRPTDSKPVVVVRPKCVSFNTSANEIKPKTLR